MRIAGARRALDLETVAVEVVVALERLDDQMSIGNHTGPRQFEFPPKSPVVDSPGSYSTRCSWSPTWNLYGSSWYTRETARIPCGERTPFRRGRIVTRVSRDKTTSQ